MKCKYFVFLRFVELLLSRGAQVDVRNKKGNSSLWLAANGGHLDVVQLLYSAGADIDSQDNRKVNKLIYFKIEILHLRNNKGYKDFTISKCRAICFSVIKSLLYFTFFINIAILFKYILSCLDNEIYVLASDLV